MGTSKLERDLDNTGLIYEFRVLQDSLHKHMNILSSPPHKPSYVGQYQEDKGIIGEKNTKNPESTYAILNNLLFEARNEAMQQKVSQSAQTLAQARDIINSSIQITELLHHMDPKSKDYKDFRTTFHTRLAEIQTAIKSGNLEKLSKTQKQILQLETTLNAYAARHDIKFHPSKDEYHYQKL